MPEDVLEKLSSVIGRKVEPVQKPVAQPKASVQTQQPSQDKSLESIIGRPLQPVKLPDMAGSRFSLYSKARQNGFDSKRAAGVAMQQAGVARTASAPTTWEKFQTTLSNVPVEPGKTVGDIGRDLGRIGQRANNPFMMSDEQWDKEKEAHKEFLERHIGKNFAAGAAQGALEFGEEFTSPVQVALAFGTFGESVLARAALKTGIKGAVPAARVLSKLVQAQFATQMIEGTSEGAIGTYQAIKDGDWEKAGQMAVESLASGLMAKGIIHHEDAIRRVRGDLEKVAREKYGIPEGKGMAAVLTNRFDQLDPYRQGEVIAETVKRSPEYQATLQKAEGQDQQAKERTQKQQTRRLNDYYGQAMEQAWNPNVAQRTIRRLQDSRVRGQRIDFERFKKRVESEEREAYSARARELDEEQWQARQAGRQAVRDERPGKRQQAAEGRAQQTQAARDLSATREGIFAQRQKADELPIEGALPQRQVEAVLTEKGLAYPAVFWGEPNYFGVEPEEAGHAVYRQTPRGLEWMGTDGNFTSDPEEKFHSHDPETADTLARITSFKANADNAAEAEGATEEQDNEAKILRQIRDGLAEGSISARDAQRKAGIAEKIKLGDQFDAAREGKLNGPFHESSPIEFSNQLESEARNAGMSDDEVQELLDNSGIITRQTTESNLNHVFRPGDYVVSKRGVKWTLDSKGMLHPDDGGAPVPLMKRGIYSNQALQLAGSGRVGYGTLTREQRRAENAKRNDVAKAIRDQQDKVDQEMRLAVQREGLVAAPEVAPRADVEEKGGRAPKWLEKPPAAPGTEALRKIGKLILKAPADENSVIQSIARANSQSPEEVMRIALANDPERANTTEAKVARLEVGDRISDDFRKDRPWTVEEKRGKLWLRSGQANPIELDRLNPSERVRQLVERGEITSDSPEFTQDDARKAAFDAPHVVHQKNLVDQVKERMEGKKDPEPKNQAQADAQATAATYRFEAAHDQAVDAVKKVDTPATDKVEQVVNDADKAAEAIKLAKEAQAQEAEAKSKAGKQGDFPQRAPISIGLRGNAGVVDQNNRQFNYHHELVPIGSVVISHVWDGDNLVRNPDFPRELQPRDPDERRVLQRRLDAQRFAVSEDGRTSGYNFDKYANPTIDALSGPPLLEGGGRTVSGNGRLQRLIKHLQVLNEISDVEEREAALAGLRERMKSLALSNGITDYPDDGAFYIDARVLDDPIESVAEANKLGLLFNESEAENIQEAARGLVYSRTLDDDIVNKIGRMVEESEGGLDAAMRTDPYFFAKLVADKFGVPASQQAEWFRKNKMGDDVLTEGGERLFTKAMMAYVVNDPDVLAGIEGEVPGRAFTKALGYMVRMRVFPELDITGKVVEALKAAQKTVNADRDRAVSRDRWDAVYNPSQTDLAGMEEAIPPEPDRVTEAIWRSLHASQSANPRAFSDRMKRYLGDEEVQAGMFGGPAPPETPAERFNRVFASELKQVAYRRGDKQETISDDEFNAALRNRELSDVERDEAENPEHKEDRAQTPEQLAGGEQPPVSLKGEIIPPGESKNINLIPTDEAIRRFRAGESVFASINADNPAGGIMPLENEAEIREFAGQLYGNRKASRTLEATPKFGPPPTVGEPPRQAQDIVSKKKGTVVRTLQSQWSENIVQVAEMSDGKFIVQEVEPKNHIVLGQEAAIYPSIDKAIKAAEGWTRKPQRHVPRAKTAEVADAAIAKAKTDQGYVTPNQLLDFLQHDPATAHAAHELFRHAQLVAEHVWKYDHPEGVERKDALAWILKDRVGALGRDDSETAHRGRYSDPLIEKGFGDRTLKLFKSADASTFIHEFFHVIFPYLSDEDLHAIDSIGGKKVWDGKRSSLRGDVYTKLSEKLSGGGERFLRDENPTGFTSEVKAVLTKLKAIMRDIYVNALKDPLSMFKNSEESREVFSKMFHIADFDVADTWKKQVDKARAAKEKASKEASNPLVKLKNELGAKTAQESLKGDIDDTIGDYVSPVKTVTFLYDSKEDAIAAATEGISAGKIKGAEIVKGDAGVWGVRFNTKENLPSTLNQPAIEEPGDLGVRLEKLEDKLKSTPPYQMMQRKLLELQIRNLKNEIRSNHGVEERKPEANPELAKAALQEVKDARGEQGTNRVRENANAIPRPPQPEGTRGIPRPPKLGMPNDAATGGKRVGAGAKPAPRAPASLEDVRPVSLEPLPKERGTPVGTLEGEPFDLQQWREALRRSGLPENIPPPTVPLSRQTAEKLKYPGQKQSVQIALSALMHGDGVVLGNATGSGKTYLASALIKEFQNANPNARILYITKNAKLKAKTRDVAANTFGFNIDVDKPKDVAVTGAYAVSYMGMMQDSIFKQIKWDLVVADESGEARNWFKPENQQGKLLMEVVNNSKKAVYMSATPFHSPSEYGYLEKLGLWKKGMFDKWIAENFAHENVDGKIVAKLDPGKQAKLRQQLIERGQFVSQAISYDGFSAHFGVVPVTDQMKRGLDRIREGFARARAEFLKMGKKGLAEKSAAFEATYTKAFLERERLPQAIELARKARENGWQVVLFSEHSADDLFRREREEGEEASTYQQLDDAMGGQLSRIIPPFPNVYGKLREAFGAEIGDYSGRGNTQAERDKAVNEFLAGQTPMMYTTYAAGGIGVDMHDADFPDLGVKGGDKPRISIFLGPPYSGVLLEQAMGRTWRFGVKSNTISVFLATDSEPDIRLMTQKVGPRMRALRAAVLGEKDSLASAMATYTDEEKVKARQDALAYAEGNEMKVDANSFTVRSKKRDVGVQDWSAIQFPSAEHAKNKGMKYGEDVPGGDWSTLYQAKFDPPPSTGEAKTENAINDVAASAAKNPEIPHADIALGAAKAVEVSSVAPEGIDKAIAGKKAMEAALVGNGFSYDPETGNWKAPHKIVARQLGDDISRIDPREKKFKRYPLGTLGMGFDQRAISAGRKIGAERQVRDVLNLTSDYYQANEGYNGPLVLGLTDIFNDANIDFNDKKLMREVVDVHEGRRASADERVNKAVAALSKYYDDERDLMASKGVHRADGGTFRDVKKNPQYFPHFTDWEMELEDPDTGEKKKLREITDDTDLNESAKLKYFERMRQELGADVNTVKQWLQAVNEDRRRSINPPLNGTVTQPRLLNHPFYHKDFWAFIKHAKEVSSALALEETFGHDMGRLDESLKKVPNRQLRTDLKSSIATTFEHQDWSTRVGQLVRAGQGIEAITKMTLSPLSVATHQIHALMGLKMGLRGLKYQAMANYNFIRHPHEFMREKYYMGVVSMKQNPYLLEGQRRGLAGKYFDLSGFSGLYRWTRAIVGDTAGQWMDQDALSDLKKGGKREEEARRLLKNTMLIGDLAIDRAIANGKWDEDSLGRAERAFTDKIAFSENPNQMPRTARMSMAEGLTDAEKNWHAAARGMYMLQSFSIKAYSLLKENLYDEVVVHHNLKPLAPFLLLYPIAGAALMGAKAGVTGGFHRAGEKAKGKKHEHDRWDTFMDEFRDIEKHPWAGALKFYLDSLCTVTGMERTKRWADIGMMTAMGNKEKVANMARYFATDETEQGVGGLYSDLFWAGETQGQGIYDYLHTKHEISKWPAFMRDEARELEQLIPFVKVIPKVEETAHPGKKTSHGPARF